MRLSRDEIEKVAKWVVKYLNENQISISDHEKAENIIKNVINENLEDEKRLEEDALKLLKQHRQALGGNIDEDKALRMIKDKLAKERKFVL